MGRYKPALSTRIVESLEWLQFAEKQTLVLPPQQRFVSPKSRDLYWAGVAKYRFDAVKDESGLDAATARVTRRIQEHVPFGRSLTLEEAVERVVYTAGASSPGHWYLRWGQTKGEVLRNPDFLNYLTETIEAAPRRGFPRPWYTASLKDELRPMKDGAVKPARLFMPVDLVLLVAQVMVWGDFNDHFVSTTFCGGLGGGTFHGRWDATARRLNKHPLLGETDGQRYDTTQSARLREAVYKVRGDCCEGHPLLGLLLAAAVTPYVAMPDGRLVSLGGGNTSGGFNTLVDNSILSMIAIEYSSDKMGVNEGQIEYVVTGDRKSVV